MAVLYQLLLRDARVTTRVHQDAELIEGQPRLGNVYGLQQARAKQVQQIVQQLEHVGRKR